MLSQFIFFIRRSKMRLNIINKMISTLTLATLLLLSDSLAIRIGQDATDIEEVTLDAFESMDSDSESTAPA